MKAECPYCSRKNEIDGYNMEDGDEQTFTCSECRLKFASMYRIGSWFETSECDQEIDA